MKRVYFCLAAVILWANVPASADGDLILKDIRVGTGKEAFSGSNVTVHYVGTLTNGKKFDSSRDRRTPFTFNLGAGEVIKGWDRGVRGMKEGGIRKLTIPPELGYGSRGAGASIPPNSTLIFEVELLKVY
ncbi:FKBP-type peptidyl-prolyl cis-trans isomerase [Leptospira gomenensis]|uniref:Peptidyl-prolyl cis-trans isomerase n=1 Tax=Leptospira gomenensis TaxID=2484974 RepID=A0A5F1YEF9_9LEPT|nr:FKBP-type peptidyl-prolyl cis-trans isomerase [Leptospira gomenensis]TGK37526.1 FKBP-type peptidyl-prolyl cis-trans isomerase [Leptospira gomenensis]TGK39468.1 FKBP-type peptidyl-prolyl cis-trans isomerase [Leptospira gomenensis]TGK43110.1 FKBP-type peptidyl-prolyl cis-trans isomerase [Leptospira gomenensis]TGK55061.1 FKBP-type peptidyl-prolyl cis-trans isomerase [Leptospira gomenensis]